MPPRSAPVSISASPSTHQPPPPAPTPPRIAPPPPVPLTPRAPALGITPFVHGSAVHTDVWKTQGLKQALEGGGFDLAFGGARRDEEKSRAKERVFSMRNVQH